MLPMPCPPLDGSVLQLPYQRDQILLTFAIPIASSPFARTCSPWTRRRDLHTIRMSSRPILRNLGGSVPIKPATNPLPLLSIYRTVRVMQFTWPSSDRTMAWANFLWRWRIPTMGARRLRNWMVCGVLELVFGPTIRSSTMMITPGPVPASARSPYEQSPRLLDDLETRSKS